MINAVKKQNQRGFTLVELTLSIAFLGALVLISSAIIVQTISIYNKGVALKQINQAGRSLIEDINRLSSSGFEIKLADDGKAGYLCIKDSNIWRSYAWNSVQVGVGTTTTANAKQFTLGGSGQYISLVRSNDGVNGDSYCQLPAGADVAMNAAEVTPILTKQVRILSVDITPSADPSLKKIAFWIGTYDSSGALPNMTPDFAASEWKCKGGNLGDFCAVSKFETVIYTPNVEGW